MILRLSCCAVKKNVVYALPLGRGIGKPSRFGWCDYD
jgi:hypothetical protein